LILSHLALDARRSSGNCEGEHQAPPGHRMDITTNPPRPVRRWRRRLALVPIIGVALSVLAGAIALEAVRAHDRALVQRQVEAFLRSFQERRNGTEDLLRNLRSLFHVKPDLGPEAFREAITGLAIRLKDVQAIGWAPIVKGEERSAFEAAGQRELFPAFEIREGDPATELVRAKTRDLHFPLLYLDPPERNPHLVGIDLGVGDVGPSFQLARVDGQVTLSPRVRVRFGEEIVDGLVAAMAVYRPKLRPPDDAERARQATGFVAAFIAIDEALTNIVERIPDFGLDVLLKDVTPDAKAGVLGVYTTRGAAEASRLREEAHFRVGPCVEQSIGISGRAWQLVFRRGSAWEEASGPMYPAAVLCCGLLITLIVTQYLWTTLLRAEEVERLVEKRTAELSMAMGRLEEETRQRLEMVRKLQETQKLESLGLLAGGIAHDFNNLLTTMLGNASLARMDLPAAAPARELLHQIEEAALRAADLCKQMLAYAGKGRFVVAAIDISRLVVETTELLRLSISKKASLKFDLAPNLPAVVGDATQLRQVLMNLVMNASEAIGDRPGKIVVRVAPARFDAATLQGAVFEIEATGGSGVMLEVTDDGCGMTPETLARIFDPFFTTKFTGRGLGLAAVLGIARSHQGALLVRSESGKGSVFQLLLPSAQGKDGPRRVGPTPSEVAWRGEGRLLVVDDEDQVREITARCLRRQGFAVETACDGREAIEKFQAQPDAFRAVVLDLLMPGMDGVEAFRALRDIRPGVRVLLMSGYSEQDASGRFGKETPQAFLQKPFMPEDLQRSIREVLDQG
jgi:signal transduction histidine kinase/ActR/RegA family two-component response regulator